MRGTSVIARFLPLLDVTLLLLGVLIVMMAQVEPGPSGPPEGPDVESRFLYIYPGWRGSEEGKCFRLKYDKDKRLWRKGERVRTDTDVDINSPRDRGKPILLLFTKDNWTNAWSKEKINRLESAWNRQVVPLYGFLDEEPK